MNTSESADELVKIYLEGMETILKISGTGAKNIAMALIAMSKERTQTKGKTRLTNMLKSGKALDIFTIKAEDLKKFSQEAKKYGILYCALANKKNNKIDGMVDIMVREEDGAKLNRISERFKFEDVATIKKEFEKSKQDISTEKAKSENEQFIDDIMPKDEEKQNEIPSNTTKETEEKNQSENSLNTKLKDKVENFKENKKSVKQELKEIEQELKVKEQTFETPETQRNIKNKSKGKRFKEPKHLDTASKSRKSKKRAKGRSK